MSINHRSLQIEHCKTLKHKKNQRIQSPRNKLRISSNNPTLFDIKPPKNDRLFSISRDRKAN